MAVGCCITDFLKKAGEVISKGFGVSSITNTIYYGTRNKENHMWTGKKKEDVTAGVLAAAYKWFMGNMDGCDEYSISYPGTGFELVMRRKKVE